MTARPLVDMDRVVATNNKTLIRAYAAIPELRIETVEAARFALQSAALSWIGQIEEIQCQIALRGLDADQSGALLLDLVHRMAQWAEGFSMGSDQALATAVDIAQEAVDALSDVVDTSLVSLNAAQHELLRSPANASNA